MLVSMVDAGEQSGSLEKSLERMATHFENIPLIGKALNLATGGLSPFHCEVYFINKSEQMAIKWGTDSRVQFVEPTYKFPLSIGVSGEMSLKAIDSRKLLEQKMIYLNLN